MINLLREMLTYMRPAGTAGDHDFCSRYIRPLGATRDEHGNYHIIIGDSPVMWSAHTDTVHRYAGRQYVTLTDGVLTSSADCLGADDTAGVFILIEMIKRGIAGHYVFHYAEEKGGVGSRALADENPTWLQGIKYAIAFDRAGFSDVITHQLSRRTCSDVFGNALADHFNRHDHLAMCIDDGGIYTDTESYAGLIAECTNVSVGYQGAHTSKESLELAHVFALLESVSTIDVAGMPIDRDPSIVDDLFDYVDDTDVDDDTAARGYDHVSDWRRDWLKTNGIGRDYSRDIRVSKDRYSYNLDDYDYYLTQTQAEVQRDLQARLRKGKL